MEHVLVLGVAQLLVFSVIHYPVKSLVRPAVSPQDAWMVRPAVSPQDAWMVHPAFRPRSKGFMGMPSISRAQKMETIIFLLYTKDNPSTPVILDLNSKSSLAAVDTKLDTKVLIHGWHGDRDTLSRIKNAYVSKSDCNVIIVDWHSLAQSNMYPESKADTEIVGARTAQLLDNLADNGLDLSRVNCVGHSLGGHTVGIVGDRVTKSRVGMITGLDPAGPMYDYNSTPNKNKLDSEDGIFVLAVHTNAKRLGSKEMLSTVDVWVNDGTSQPGCAAKMEKVTGLCSHLRVIDIWAECIIGVQPIVGWQCDSWSTFEDGKCEKNSKIIMGDNINQSSRGQFFVPTGAKSPFAVLSEDDDDE